MREIIRAVLAIGVPCSVLGMLLMAWLCTRMDFPVSGTKILAAVPLLCGAMCSGTGAGRRKRRGGMLIGGSCGALLTGIWYGAACVLVGRTCPLHVFFLTIPTGSVGGIIGVNLSAPLASRRVHTPRRLRRALFLKLSSLRTPPRAQINTPDA